MTVKVNPDHLQSEITFETGPRSIFSKKISWKSMHNFLREADKPIWSHNALLGGGNNVRLPGRSEVDERDIDAFATL